MQVGLQYVDSVDSREKTANKNVVSLDVESQKCYSLSCDIIVTI